MNARKATPNHRRRLSCCSRVDYHAAANRTSDHLRTQVHCNVLMEDKVQNDQNNERDAKQPTEKIRHGVFSFFRVEV